MNTVTPNIAIRKTQRIIYVSLLVMVLSGVLGFLLVHLLGWPGWTNFIGALIFPLLGFYLCSFYMLNEWWIWALKHVRNVHELKHKAILANLLQEAGSWKAKYAFKTKAQQRQIAALEYKFTEPDEVILDTKLPDRTEVFYSKRIIWAEFGFYILFLIGSIALIFFNPKKIIGGVLFAGFSLWKIRKGYHLINYEGPALSFDKNGVLFKGDLIYWKDVQIIEEPVFRHESFRLLFFNQDDEMIDSADIQVYSLAIKTDELCHFIKVYHQRYLQQYKPLFEA